jgi:two-component system CheB/CheR fusion protein
MTLKTKSFVYGVAFALIFYLLDAMLDYLLFYRDLGLLKVLVTAVPLHELYTRALGVCIIMIMGIVMPELLRIPVVYRNTPAIESHLSSDPTLMVNISNEIRTPLNAIIGFVDLLRDSRISETSKKLYLSHIRTSGKYLLELVNNITDITLIETGTMYINLQECRLNQLMEKLQLQYERRLADMNNKILDIRMNTAVQDDNFTILTDEVRLYQVLVNLIENAFSFTSEGTIEFGYTQPERNVLEFYVKDSGAGLSPERLKLLFSKFRKMGSNQMRPFDIVSLRMNIVKQLIILFGSELKADSRLGQGSDFRFRLKVTPVQVSEQQTVTAERDHEKSKRSGWGHKKILIAEDVESNFVYLKEILKPTGVQILWAENGKEALALCREQPDIDLILMDILMPEMDGYEAARIIKKSFPDLPIIAQTAYNIDEMEYKDASNYFNKFMIKPIWSIDLLNTLTKYLGTH